MKKTGEGGRGGSKREREGRIIRRIPQTKKWQDFNG